MMIFRRSVLPIRPTILGFLLSMLAAGSLLAAEISGIDVSPSGYVSIRCSETPHVGSSFLADDKLKITLNFADMIPSDDVRETAGSGIVEVVYAQKQDSVGAVYIILRRRAGYSYAVLPYSRSVRVYVVDWNDLKTADDHYHSALLAEAGGGITTAREFYEHALKAGSGEAATMLALLHLREGDLERARSLFVRAMDLRTSLDDAFAGMAEVLYHSNEAERSQYFLRLFRQKSGIDDPGRLLSDEEAADLMIDPPSLAAQLTADLNDTLNTVAKDSQSIDSNSEAAPDSVVQTTPLISFGDSAGQGPSLFAQQYGKNRRERNAEFQSPLSGWVKWGGIFMMLIVLGGGIIVAIVYYRWRQKKLASESVSEASARTAAETSSEKSADSAFEQEMQSVLAGTDTASMAGDYDEAAEKADEPAVSADTPEQAAVGQADDNEDRSDFFDESDIRDNERDGPPPLIFETLPAGIRSIDNPDTTAHIHTIEDPDWQQPEHAAPEHAAQTPSDGQDNLGSALRQGQGAVEMALNLQNRRLQEQQDKTTGLRSDEIPSKRRELSDLARSLGVSAGELQMKKNLGTLSEDDEEKDRQREGLKSIFGAGSTTKGKNN